ncbi:MAG: 5-(carboxyamino)imidazole ribonucleotide mutase [Selenomonadaceae bacterium]|nr:5-(carboxyamino)imidazole ribonucleotide mutase [Selenomonadaceae bacterium]
MDVAIIMGSDSDWKVMKKSVEVLKDFGVSVDVTVASAHRTPYKVQEFVNSCDAQGVKVFIAAAGCAAHLAGVIASYTTKPIIGVPIAAEPLKGWDALLSTVQMPPGVPVATMAINGAKNAAIFAVEILALSSDEVKQKLDEFRADMVKEVERKADGVKHAFAEINI